MTYELAVIDQEPASLELLQRQVGSIQAAMKGVMIEGTHFGVIPGTDKPTLLKPGAEKICMMFRLLPDFREEIVELGQGHREYRVRCELRHQNQQIAVGLGSCSTMESKYRWRAAERTCPKCDKPAIIKGQEKFGGGWLCWAKKGGCGAKFSDTDKAITAQVVGRMENPDIADLYNTCLKMASKRAHVAATLSATAASDIFTQGMEDFPVAATAPAPARPGSG